MARKLSSIFWAMFNEQLIIYPKQSAGASIEITGTLTPPSYTDADLYKEMVKVPDQPDDGTEVQGLSDVQLKLVRYRVVIRLMEDQGNYEGAAYMQSQARLLEHKMRETFEDGAFTSSIGIQEGAPNV